MPTDRPTDAEVLAVLEPFADAANCDGLRENDNQRREDRLTHGKIWTYYDPIKERDYEITVLQLRAARDLHARLSAPSSAADAERYQPVSSVSSVGAGDTQVAEDAGGRRSRLSIDGISLAVARQLVELFGEEETDMTVEFIRDGHSGSGFYAWCTEYPEDGSDFLGPASEFSSLSVLPASPAQGKPE